MTTEMASVMAEPSTVMAEPSTVMAEPSTEPKLSTTAVAATATAVVRCGAVHATSPSVVVPCLDKPIMPSIVDQQSEPQSNLPPVQPHMAPATLAQQPGNLTTSWQCNLATLPCGSRLPKLELLPSMRLGKKRAFMIHPSPIDVAIALRNDSSSTELQPNAAVPCRGEPTAANPTVTICHQDSSKPSFESRVMPIVDDECSTAEPVYCTPVSSCQAGEQQKGNFSEDDEDESPLLQLVDAWTRHATSPSTKVQQSTHTRHTQSPTSDEIIELSLSDDVHHSVTCQA